MDFKQYLGPLLVGIGLLLAALFYFSPIVFEGKSLPEHDNQQSRAMQTEIHTYYKENPGHTILWTNQLFVGMPTYQLLGSQKSNMAYRAVENAVYLRLDILNPPMLLAMLMLMAYLSLLLLGFDYWLAGLGGLAFGFITNNLILMEAGHSTKLHTLVYVMPLMAMAWKVFRGKLLLAGGLFAFFLAVHIRAYHVQITYYTFLSLGILGLAEGVHALMQKKLGDYAKAVGVLAFATLLGVGSNATMLWTTAEYSSESIRGRSELTQKAATNNGLDKDYIFNWSLGKMESMALIFPNFYGGGSAHKARPALAYDKNSATSKAVQSLARSGQVPQEEINNLARLTSSYWGPQPFTSGPIYYGIVLFFLAVLGGVLLQGTLRVWLLGTIGFFLVLAWGKYFPAFNNLMVDYFPMYNKFRAVTMTMTVAQVPLVLLAVFGLKALKDYAEGKKTLAAGKSLDKLVLTAAGIAAAVCAFALVYSFVGDLTGKYDEEMLKFGPYVPVVEAMQADRAGLIQGDALRGFGFLLACFLPLWAYSKGKLSWKALLPLLTFVCLADQIHIGKQYVNKKSFVDSKGIKEATPPSPADLQILKDQDPHFRVLDLSQPDGPFNSATPCFYHKNVGGYNAAKPMLYQELRDAYFESGEILSSRLHLLEMLNVKYIIQDPNRPVKIEAFGNAWLSGDIEFVANADAELQAVGAFDPLKKTIVQERYRSQLEGVGPKQAGETIRLTTYHPERLSYEYEVSGPRLAVFSELYYPTSKGWNIYLDGEKLDAELLKVNYLLRGIVLKEGKHTLEMRFEPRSFYMGEWISLLSSLAAIAFLAFGLWKYRQAKKIKQV